MDWEIMAAMKAVEAGGEQGPVSENWQKTTERGYRQQHHQKISA
jgi:hypothetical protein